MSKSILLIRDIDKVYDYDGNEYNTITIGTQKWLDTNIRTTRYIDGTSIYNVTVVNDWKTLLPTDDVYGWYELDNSAPYLEFGPLYTWEVTQKTLINGYHVPTQAELATLSSYVSGNGYTLQVSGNTFWTWNFGIDTYGYGLKGAGQIEVSDGFGTVIKQQAFLWTSEESSGMSAYRTAFNDDGDITPAIGNKATGQSIRLIKD